MLNINFEGAYKFLTKEEISKAKEDAKKAYKVLKDKSGPGNDFIGWFDYPISYDKEELERIKAAAQTIQRTSEVLVVIGIGGSYLGARAVIEALTPYFENSGLEIIFAGNSISSTYLTKLRYYLGDKDFSVNVISKSGTTTEPAIAFRFLYSLLKKKYFKDELREHIFFTTDSTKGALRQIGIENDFEMFTIPSDMGGRYSVFSAVGLLPIAAMGFDIDSLLKGAKTAYNNFKNKEDNEAFEYALVRNALLRKGYDIEILESFEPCLSYISEWWKQLFGESEGKEGKGIYPSSVIFTTDLHSLGQYIQDGRRNLFETCINIVNPVSDIDIPFDKDNLDSLNYIAGKSIDYVNKAAMNATMEAHIEGGVPQIRINIDELDEINIGYLLYFFMVSCGISGYTLGVNPFNQEGVEAYKKNMFIALGKPGYTK
ncbi:glucose-6-phosphate isomerase [bacterium]|nr:glucose-6-phosphate isomerase [bacterium]